MQESGPNDRLFRLLLGLTAALVLAGVALSLFRREHEGLSAPGESAAAPAVRTLCVGQTRQRDRAVFPGVVDARPGVFGPFAAAIVFALLVASGLTLFVVPALYLGFEDPRVRLGIRGRHRPTSPPTAGSDVALARHDTATSATLCGRCRPTLRSTPACRSPRRVSTWRNSGVGRSP